METGEIFGHEEFEEFLNSEKGCRCKFLGASGVLQNLEREGFNIPNLSRDY